MKESIELVHIISGMMPYPQETCDAEKTMNGLIRLATKAKRQQERSLKVLALVEAAHDEFSKAAEDPEGSNDVEHDKGVCLMERLNDFYLTVRKAK